MQMTEQVKKLLKEQLWILATCYDHEPNAVPVGLKTLTEDGKLAVGDVFMETTVHNLQKNGRAAVSVCDGKEGYQIKGAAEYFTSGPIVEAFQKQAETLFHGVLSVKGAVVITPERVIVTTGGPDNKKEL